MPSFWSPIFPTLLATLLGVIVGGIITYLTTRTIEDQKWKQQKKDKYLQDRREALGLVLDWIDPIDRAVNRAIVLSSPYREDRGEIRQRWPNLLEEIAKLDLRPHFRVLVPKDLYIGANPIINKLDEIYTLSIQLQEERTLINSEPQENHWKDEWKNDIKKLEDELGNVRALTDAYKQRLEEEFKATYS